MTVQPTGLDDAVAVFTAEHRRLLLDPMYARERCVEVSERFAALCRRHGVSATVLSGMQMGESPFFPGATLALQGHFAVQVGDSVYDWTGRQFDPDAPVPIICTVDEWQATWPPLPPRDQR